MNDLTFAIYTLDRQRAADLARENQLVRAHRDYGQTPPRPHGRPLSAWFRDAVHHGSLGHAVVPSH